MLDARLPTYTEKLSPIPIPNFQVEVGLSTLILILNFQVEVGLATRLRSASYPFPISSGSWTGYKVTLSLIPIPKFQVEVELVTRLGSQSVDCLHCRK